MVGLEKLRTWRKANRVTLAETGGLVGVSESMVSFIERGKRRPSPMVALRISRLIGVPVRALVPDEDDAE